jgi:hypothetical protein
MIAIENLKRFLFFSFKIDQHSKIASLFFLLSPTKLFSMHFLKCLLVFIFLVRKYIFGLNSVFGLSRLIFAFSTLWSTFFLTPCKIPDRWICHTAILFLGPKFRFRTLEAYFRLFDPQSIFFLLHVKFPFDGYITRPY